MDSSGKKATLSIFYLLIKTYTDMAEKNRHQHKYFPIINMCLFMFTGESSSGIT